MKLVKILAILLIIAGLSGLIYGRFSYKRETQQAQIGSLELSVNDIETVYIPVWLSLGVMVVGGGILILTCRKS